MFQVYSKVICLHTYTCVYVCVCIYIYIYILLLTPSIVVYYKILNTVPCAVQ